MIKVAALRGICPKEWGTDIVRTKLIITTGRAARPGCARAVLQLFTAGGTATFNIQNSPGTSNKRRDLHPRYAVDRWRRCRVDPNCILRATSPRPARAMGAVSTRTHTVGGLALSLAQRGLVVQRGWPSGRHPDQLHCRLQPVDRHQGGANIAQTLHIFNQPLISNPVPEYDPGRRGAPRASLRPLLLAQRFPLGGFSDPFSIVTNGLGTTNVGGEIEASEFAPQSPPARSQSLAPGP